MRKPSKTTPIEKHSKKKSTKIITNLAQQIRELLRRPKLWGYSARTVIRELHLEGKEHKLEVEQILESLVAEGFIYLDEQDRYQSNEENVDTLIGTIDFVNPNFAYFISEGRENDVRIDARNVGNALDGDTVRIAIHQSFHNDKMEGEVLEIVKRKTDEFAGVLQISQNHAFLVPDNRKMHVDIYVPIQEIGKAQNGDKVVVKITEWHKMGKKPTGKVSVVLGKPGEHETEIHAIMAEFNLPFAFPKNIEHAAKRIESDLTAEEIAKRRDFRQITTFTIDPDNAKDFDDALSIQKLQSGNWEIGVHIADVSHYVKEGSILDKEAYDRATSVYLVDRTIPMLPERLSNELCSLRPHEEKLTFSAVFEFDDQAQLLKEWFGKTIIFSDRRFSYEEAQERIETGEGDFAQEILTLNRLAKKICAERFKSGAISFETPEVKFVLDAQGTPLSLQPKIRKDAHKLIEEFMLMANKKVAEYVFNLDKGKKTPTMVYRVHEPPNAEKIAVFSKFVARLGYKIETEGIKLATSFNTMTESLEGKAEQNVLQSLAVRTMSKAKYSIEALGHFGLAFKHYSHFTSPIRRYPDLLAHRLLEHYLAKGKSVGSDDYEEKCKHSSEREKRAADAERASIKYKQVEFMKIKDDGRVWEGIVTGVTDFGLYVEVVETKCEGMVRLSELQDDFYRLDAENYRLLGTRTGKVITFGDKVQVKVLEANVTKRSLDLELVESTPKRVVKKTIASKTNKKAYRKKR